MNKNIKIGILGGSGFYELLENPEEIVIETPFGKPSDNIMVGECGGAEIAFLPRHARGHNFPPHAIPYRANLAALKELGCETIISPAAVGSLRADIAPGTFVICDDFIDRTKRRADTYFDGPDVYHVPSTEAYCPELIKIAAGTCDELGIPHAKGGTVVVIEGPRFSSKKESRYYANMGADIINMTQYPEVVLARELEMCYLGIGLVTDWDVGLENDPAVSAVTAAEVARVFAENNAKVKELIFKLVPKIISRDRGCGCGDVLDKSKI